MPFTEPTAPFAGPGQFRSPLPDRSEALTGSVYRAPSQHIKLAWLAPHYPGSVALHTRQICAPSE